VPAISFLSDYGRDDDFVGVCHGVMASIAPEVRVLDVTHGIARHDVRAGALVLRNTLPYMPPGVHLAVVDPEVGAQRRAVAIRCAAQERILVGPDNGVLAPAADRFGGAVEAVDVGRSAHRLEPVSATFQGRDIFAPVAANLALGEPLGEAGEPLDVAELAALELPRPELRDGALATHVLAADRFGNLALDAGHDDLGGAGLRLGHPVEIDLGDGDIVRATYAVTFADVEPGALIVYEDAYRTLAIAVNRGNAAQELDVRLDHELVIRPAA
jgi:S-adenosyl-L-methionine hydrolase (adenosine-forming)